MNKKELDIHKHYLEIAKLAAKRSKAVRNKVGCVIINTDGRIIATGFNGTPSGVSNCCEIDENTTHPYVIHAELNAIFNATTNNLKDCIVYITLSPCIRCAAALVQKQVSKVIYAEQYRNIDGIEFLEEAGIETIHIE